jgi:L-aspartate oxidase
VHHPSAGVRIIRAGATILATGGAAGLYARSTNSPHATGDGIAMAHRAGVALGGMEFVQFHPTALDVPESPRPLVSEAVRGEGARLVDAPGRRILAHMHPLAELAPRDIVSRTMALLHRTQGGRCFLDARAIGDFKSRFPAIAAELHRRGMDPSVHAIPVTPAAHYLVGGITTDLCGRTSLPGLYAAGEVASTGMHGANRLASNSLLEGLVMGEITGRHAGQHSSEFGAHDPAHRSACQEVCSDLYGRAAPHTIPAAATLARSLRQLMWARVGVLRDAHGLRQAAGRLAAWQGLLLDPEWRGAWKLRNMVDVAAIITRAALARDESAGCHSRIDGPLATRGAGRVPPAAFARTTRSSNA